MLNIHRSTSFRCLADEGAVLALPKGATVYEVRNRRHFQAYGARHALNWYEYALNVGMDILNGSLYFVTECTKTMDWGIAVFYARQRADGYLRFIFDRESYRWRRQGKVEARVGSKSADNIDYNTGEPNQCVFLRGYKIMLRQDIWDKLKSATTPQDGQISPFAGTISHDSSHRTSDSQTDFFYQSLNHNRSNMGPSQTVDTLEDFFSPQASVRIVSSILLYVVDLIISCTHPI